MGLKAWEVTRIVPIDLDIHGEDAHDHPFIRTDRHYLARINGIYIAGFFERHPFGLFFRPTMGLTGYLYNRPGTTGTPMWEALWKIVVSPVTDNSKIEDQILNRVAKGINNEGKYDG